MRMWHEARNGLLQRADRLLHSTIVSALSSETVDVSVAGGGAWRPAGLLRWITTIEHEDIGLLYLLTSFARDRQTRRRRRSRRVAAAGYAVSVLARV